MILLNLFGCGFGRIRRVSRKQLVEHRVVVDHAIAAETLDLDLIVFEKLNLPALAGNGDLHHDGVVPAVSKLVRDLGLLEPAEKHEQLTELIGLHLLYSGSDNSLRMV